jgi:hypothetical protein
MIRFFVMSLLFIGGYANAHQFTPTYPELTPSYMEGIWTTDLKLFNAREEISYYQINVLDKDMLNVPFATNGERIRKIEYSSTEDIIIYVRESDRDRVVYICSESKVLGEDVSIQRTNVVSRICSKVK